MRIKINLKCSECGSKNYLTSKNKVTHPENIQVLKYCPKERKVTLHLESWRKKMYNLLLTALLVISVVLVIAIFMQPQKNPGSNVFDSGGSEALFERSKARGFEAFMQRFTGILVFFWLLIAFLLVLLSSR